MRMNTISTKNDIISLNYFFIFSKLFKVVQIVSILLIPTSFDLLITSSKLLIKVHDLSGNVNQSFSFSIFLNRIFILFILSLF